MLPYFYNHDTNKQPAMEYLEASEINIFVRHLLNHTQTTTKFDDFNDVCLQYFALTASCQHIRGMSYGFVSISRYNRRSLIYCIMETFVGFSLNADISAYDYYALIELICPNFPHRLVMDAVRVVDESNRRRNRSRSRSYSITVAGDDDDDGICSDEELPSLYKHNDIRIAVFFQFLYEEWLIFIMHVFKDMRSSGRISLRDLQNVISSRRSALPNSAEEPPIDAITLTIDSLTDDTNRDDHDFTGDINFEEFHKALVHCPLIIHEVCKVPLQLTGTICMEDQLSPKSNQNNTKFTKKI